MKSLLLAVTVLGITANPVADAQNISGTFYSILEETNSTSIFLNYAGRIWLNMTLMDPFQNLTVFAPSDDAFKKLPAEVQQQLNSDLGLLTEVMTFHFYQGVVPLDASNTFALSLAKVYARVNLYTLDDKKQLSTVSGVPVSEEESTRARNGVLYIVDRVLYPLPTGNAFKLINKDNNFNMLLLALTTADASSLLKDQDITFLAPTDLAFQRLPVGYFSKMLGDVTLLTKVLENHIVKDVWYSAYFVANGGGTLDSKAGQKLNVTVTADTLHIGEAEVTQADVSVANGVVHVIDQVLIPE